MVILQEWDVANAAVQQDVKSYQRALAPELHENQGIEIEGMLCLILVWNGNKAREKQFRLQHLQIRTGEITGRGRLNSLRPYSMLFTDKATMKNKRSIPGRDGHCSRGIVVGHCRNPKRV